MGNLNCSPADCINMRPGQLAQDCFRQSSNADGKTKVNSGTPQELFEEWTEITQQIANAFSEDPDSNLYVLKLSKPLLAHIFENKKSRDKKMQQKPPAPQPPQISHSRQHQQQQMQQQQLRSSGNFLSRAGSATIGTNMSSSYSNQRRGNFLQQIMGSPATTSSRAQRGGTSSGGGYQSQQQLQMVPNPHEYQQMVEQLGLKELLALINAHTSYPSDFLPISMQSEPIDSIGNLADDARRRGGSSHQQQTLPQLKGKYEFEIMHSSAVVFFADTQAVRRFDFQMPEQLRFSSFSLEKLQVSPGTQIEMKARQLLNQVREFFHLHNKLIVGGHQLIENEFQMMFVQGCKEEFCPRQHNWPKILSGELIHSLSLLPGLMQRDEYKDTHVLQCIIRIQSYTYGNQSQRQPGQQSSRSQQYQQQGDLSRQIHFLVIFKENLYLPKNIDYLLQLQKDISLQLTRVNEKQVLNMVFNLAPKTFLFVMSQKKLQNGNRHYKAEVQKMADKLQLQEKAYRKKRKTNGDDHGQGTTNHATAEDEETKSGLDFSDSLNADQMNNSHTIDQLMFRSHQLRPAKSLVQPRVISMLEEDIESFAKVNSENLVEQLQVMAPQKSSSKNLASSNNTGSLTYQQPQLEQQMSDAKTSSEAAVPHQQSMMAKINQQLASLMTDSIDQEAVEESHLSRYGPLEGDYLVDFSRLTADGELASEPQSDATQLQKPIRKPVVYIMDTCQKIGKLEEVGYLHYDTEILQTEQVIKSVKQTDLPIDIRKIICEESDFGGGLDSQKLRYLGVEQHWKIYYVENSLSQFIYTSARPSFAFNCMYEVQIYKSRVCSSGGLFGKELVMINESKEPVALAVHVSRPGVFLDDLVYRVWQMQAARHMEFHFSLKVYYIVHQIVQLVEREVIERGLAHNGLRLRSFSIDRLSWEIKLTSFAFAQVPRTKKQQELRGSISGFQTDKEALIGLIEDLSQLEGNSGDLKIDLCQMTDLIQDGSNLQAGIQAVLEVTRQKLLTNLKELTEIFTQEDKLEPAIEFLLKTLGQDSPQLNPFNWIKEGRMKNTLDDLLKSPPQSIDQVCRQIVYQSETPSHSILSFLNNCQDTINGAMQAGKPNRIEESKQFRKPSDEPIILDFHQLEPLQKQMSDHDVESHAAKGLTLLYYYMERQLNHVEGGISQAQQSLLSLKDLLNFDYENVYYYMIRVMMADIRLQHEQVDSASIEAIQGMAKIKLLLVLGELREQELQGMLEDLYMGVVHLDKLMEQQDLLPYYFKQRFALGKLQNGEVDPSQEVALIYRDVLDSDFSGVFAAKIANYDKLYLTFYNMQRLILMFIYHEIVCPEENYPFADMSEYDAKATSQHQSPATPHKMRRSLYQRGAAASSSSSSVSKHRAYSTSAPPLYLQLQRFFFRLFQGAKETQACIQGIFCEFSSSVLCLQLDSRLQDSYDQIWGVFCKVPGQPQKTGKQVEQGDDLDDRHKAAEPKGGNNSSEDVKRVGQTSSPQPETSMSTPTKVGNTTDSAGGASAAKQSPNTQSQQPKPSVSTKFWRTERILQLIYKRLSSFDSSLVLQQHEKFFRREYYKAAYLGQKVPRFSSISERMELEDLGAEFICYLALVLEINSNAMLQADASQIEAYEAAKTNFLRCPCCPDENYQHYD